MKLKVLPAFAAMIFAVTSLSMITPEAHGAYAFTSHTFTPCAATGKNGPSQASCRSTYSTTWDESDSNFTVTSGIQYWTVPSTGTYRITAMGAKGGNSLIASGGAGASMQGDFQLIEGAIIKILVGQSGLNMVTGRGSGGGGGGSFVTTSTNTPLIVAGGGGSGADGTSSGTLTGVDGTTSTTGTYGRDGIAAGGSSGAGGLSGAMIDSSTTQWSGSGGGGLLSAGGDSVQSGSSRANSGGAAFISGGTGGTAYTGSAYGVDGGFGGGGGGSWGASGGGGYSGGGGDKSIGSSSDKEGGGGGGSYNSGTNQVNSSGANAGTGSVTIAIMITSTSTAISLPGNASVVYKGTLIVITAVVDQPGSVTFYANAKKIGGCINRVALSTTASCNWKPTIQGSVNIYAELKPSNVAYVSSKSSTLKLMVARRSSPRT